jgi:hypothetical protein
MGASEGSERPGIKEFEMEIGPLFDPGEFDPVNRQP